MSIMMMMMMTMILVSEKETRFENDLNDLNPYRDRNSTGMILFKREGGNHQTIINN